MSTLNSGMSGDGNLKRVFEQATQQSAGRKSGCCGGGGGGGSFIRGLVVHLEGEQMKLSRSVGGSTGNMAKDWDKIVKGLEADRPAYVLIKTDTGSWYFLTYVPEDTDAKTKMIFGATGTAIKSDLGSYNFVDSMHGDTKDELTYKAFQQANEVPDELLTPRERMARQLANENYDHLAPPSRSQKAARNPMMNEFMGKVKT